MVGCGRGTRNEARRRTVRWCATVASVFSVRKNMYWTMIGAVESEDAESESDFSTRAQDR